MTDNDATSQLGPRASFGLRLGAFLIDFILLIVVNIVVSAVVGKTAGQAIGILIGLAYYGYFEGSPSGQTVGKRALNIRVVRFADGGPLGIGGALLRYVCKIISGIPCFLGFLWMLWDPQKQTWHDKLAGTVVVPTSSYPVEAWPG